MMHPERAEHRGSKGLVLVHRCAVCGFVRPNRVGDDPVQGDDIDAIIALISNAG
jgi:RNHCP domain